MGQLWYYEQSGSTAGPVPIDEIRELVTAGTLTAADRIKSESMGDWVTVSSLQEEIDGVGGPATQVLDDELDERNSGLNIDDFNLESSTDTSAASNDLADDELPEDLPDIDSFVVAGDKDSPRPDYVSSHKPKDEPPEPEEEEAEEEFLVRSLGMTLGPLTYEEIVEMARTGSLTKGDEIKIGESEWIAVESIPQVGTAVFDSSAGEEADSPGDSSAGAAAESSAGETPSKSSRGKKPRKSRSQRSSAGKSSPGRKRRRRKKKKKDEFLAEIFAEVFTEDGQVRHERTAAAPAAPAAAAADPAMGNPAMANPAMANPGMANPGMGNPAMGNPAMGNPGMGNAGMGGMNGMNGMGGGGFNSQQARPAFKPPPKAKKKKKSSGEGMSLPEPKVMGMIGGGVLAAIILIGGFTGILPIPGFGVDPDSFFKEVAEVYPIAAAGDAEVWRNFNRDYGATAQDLMIDLLEDSKSDPTAKRHYNAAKAVVKLAGQPHHFKEGQKEAFQEFQKILVGG